ncbi:hypothetical protein [Ornithinimicrobium kibberense]|uniref:hypothetical protein n=1 Tax=Ornithinimicrobium kibberense TaxID=282060 RepID=UPI0036172D12
MAALPVVNTSAASATERSSTSAIVSPCRRCSSTSGRNRRPPHSSHGVLTPCTMTRSVQTTPWPRQTGQAPSELGLNSEAGTPLALANAVRTGSRSPEKVAGLDRRDPRIGDWSTMRTPSRPASDPCTSEDLPDPATPVTATSTPRGTSTSTSRRLLVLAPRICRYAVGSRTFVRRPGRWSSHSPVTDPEADRPSGAPA